MSRLGKLIIKVPSKTKIIIKSRLCIIKGPLGSLCQIIPKSIRILITSTGLFLNSFDFKTKSISKEQGLLATLLRNKIFGVNYKFEKKLQVIGVGYRAKLLKNKLILFVGYSHSTFLTIPLNLNVIINNNGIIHIQGIDKQSVCLFASLIRKIRPPEPYKGKGIKYINEILIKKIGKSNKI